MDKTDYRGTPFGAARQTIGRFGYVAYFPKPLPRALNLAVETVQELADAEAALGRLAGAGRLLPSPHLLVRPYLAREAVASTRIEGTRAEVGDVYALAASGGPPDPDVEEVLNYITAMEVGLSRLESLPISVRLLREMHAVLLSGVRGRDRQPGELRTSQNWIGPAGATLGNATFVPPPPEELADLLSDLERFAHETGPPPVLVRAGLLHYQFETIHPFLDGNGRLGRLLIVFLLVAAERLPSPLLYLSPYFERHRNDYYACLQNVRERGDIDAWLQFFLRGVQRQSNDAVDRAERLLDLRERYRQQVQAATRSQAVGAVDLTFAFPILTSRVVERELGVSRPTALKLLGQLAGYGILTERATGPRGQRRWVAEEVLDTITADQPA